LTTVLEPETPNPSPATRLPVRIRVGQDLERNRLTVFFRALLAIPHLIWLALWGLVVFFLVIANWVATLIKGQSPETLHRYLTAYLNYNVHVYSYFYVAANRYPGFTGDPGYDVDMEFDPPAPQRRWTVALRLLLMVPVLILAFVIAGTGGVPQYDRSSSSTATGLQIMGILSTAGVVAWFYSLFRGRAPEGVTRLLWYCLHYGALAWSYIFVLTDRYPNPDPALLGRPRRPPPHPVALRVPADELERSRVTVFFRLPLFVPHLIWLTLWGILTVIVGILNWIATLVRGRSPAVFHRFLAAFVRYLTHVTAFSTVVANPFPGFTGAAGSYPVDAEIAGPERQARLVTAFRLILVVPALLISSALGGALYVAAFFGWWIALFTGRMPRGLRNLGAFAIRYSAQLNAYAFLLTDRYPYAGPPADAESVPEALQESPLGGDPAAVPPEAPPTSADPTDPRGVWRDSPFVNKPVEPEPPA
jgi:hypothetical protein